MKPEFKLVLRGLLLLSVFFIVYTAPFLLKDSSLMKGSVVNAGIFDQLPVYGPAAPEDDPTKKCVECLASCDKDKGGSGTVQDCYNDRCSDTANDKVPTEWWGRKQATTTGEFCYDQWVANWKPGDFGTGGDLPPANLEFGQIGGKGGNQYFMGKTVSDYVKDVISIGSVVLGGLAVLKIIFSGAMYATSAGNPKQMTAAKEHFLYAIIGVALLVGANIFLSIIGADLLPK